MKKIILIALLTISVGANAQQMFDFSWNSPRMEGGFNFGEAGSFTPYARLALGANILFHGFYLDFLKSEPQHRYTNVAEVSDAKWNDSVAFCINASYQIPVFKWLRIMPMIGYAQTNEGITDGSKLDVEVDDYSFDYYHPYKVTPGTRTHYFNYGGGLSIQPCKWFSINLIATSRAIYGGFSINALAFVD
ncbi:MAG: hypothetical protein IKZ60_04310 [Bacteroidales bacterium]|nr:hypothetical protein [Bacteroidales bacterium]